MDDAGALIQLGNSLRQAGYTFTTITPASHARVNGRPGNGVARSVRDVFGWSRPFEPGIIPAEWLRLLREAGAVDESGPLARSLVRFSTAGDQLYVHSAFPTVDSDSVFFGPDTYRYLALLRRLNPSAKRAVDVGAGSGAGGISISSQSGGVVLADINSLALRYAAVNAAINGVRNADVVKSDVLAAVEGEFDLVISNPPYLADDHARLYRDGGGQYGEALSLRIVRESLQRLNRPGRLILYTATAIVDGRDTFRDALAPLLDGLACRYEEIDPDVFGEELERNRYRDVERIAVVSLDLSVT